MNYELQDKGDILIYILLFTANLDGHISGEELKQIIKTDNRESFIRVREIFNNDNDFASMNKIQSYKKQLFDEGETIDSIVSMIVNMFKGDGNFTNREKYLAEKVGRMLK